MDRCVKLVLTLASGLLLGGPGLNAQDVEGSVATADVLALALEIEAEIESLRWHMGRPPEARPLIQVENVSIRENFNQALNLWRRVNQLGTELVGGGEVPPAIASPRGSEYAPEHVYEVLAGVADRLQEIRAGSAIVASTSIDAEPEEAPAYGSGTPTDVFKSVIQSTRQVNRMLERPPQPGDVYQRVQQAVFYASEILATVGEPRAFPPLPAHQPGMRPGHVYNRLIEVAQRLSIAFDALGLHMLKPPPIGNVIDESIVPGDVLDIATLLLTEIEYLHSRTTDARVPILAEHPGRRWPSDVYRLAGVLDEQTLAIMNRARRDATAFVGSPRP
ncbi:MAG: hypothetical protein HKO53_12780 [Gemmatimonadetes bacterium]|nr:hypothetical protein [Gemmatimonadota bacterium]